MVKREGRMGVQRLLLVVAVTVAVLVVGLAAGAPYEEGEGPGETVAMAL